MSWSTNNRAHTSLCFFELWHQEQRDASFEEAGDWSTSYLIRAAAGDSAEMRAGKARTHAELLDGVFTGMNRASYEQGVDREAAVASMVEVLVDDAKQLRDLGDPVDEAYRFLGEV